MGKTYRASRGDEEHKASPKGRAMLIAKLLSLRMRDNQIGYEIDSAWKSHMKDTRHTQDI